VKFIKKTKKTSVCSELPQIVMLSKMMFGHLGVKVLLDEIVTIPNLLSQNVPTLEEMILRHLLEKLFDP